MKTSIATVSLSGTLREKMEAAAAAGFDGVELFESDLLTFSGSPADVRSMAAGLGLAIVLYQPFRDFEAMPEPMRQRNLERAERKFEIMHQLGADVLLVCSNVHEATVDDDARAAADLAEMAERARRRGLRIGYEALAWGRHVKRWSHAWKIVRAAGHPSLGLVLDSFHTLALRDSIDGIARLPSERIFFVQLADAPWLELDVLSWSRHFRNFPGQGQLPVDAFLAAVAATGYDGPVSLEIFNDEFRASPAIQTARDAMRSLVWILSETSYGEKLPPAPAFDGVEFVEFAVDDDTAPGLAMQLASLGFHPAGRHRSKLVDLYRQCGINVILNREQDTVAAEHFALHGPSVCAVALRVTDAAGAVARASALFAPEWRVRIGPGERHVPAIRAPDDTLIYFVEPGRPIYEDDFHLVDDAPTASLIDVEYVTQALPQSMFSTFVLFYRTVLGLECDFVGEVADPYGLVTERTMVSRDRCIAIHLNVSQSRMTATGRFISATGGAGVHHIAFRTDDITRAVSSMRDRGARFLPVPASYYADLAATFALGDAELSTLQRYDLLYDRDDGGDMVHAFTETFADRHFFEIVQRRGHRRSAHANAVVRLAAQARRLVPS
ncbi:MAG: sugar phosphate isomerase/epimerase and 4-hydroxyphenylpyruvate domain-containing protein [Actinobacteria bacterium]|nr:sugar phosphate isomerase/epimerase and 4-hydroxyphenylpyruvate domain-containing protein [Actinomycetota bacterium]